MTYRLVLALLLTTGSCTPSMAAEDGDGTHDIDACQGDIHRLCDRYFPDETLVANCLVEQRANLSRACAEVLARPPRNKDERN